MKWFKFYGLEFITDPKIKQLNAVQQLAWVYLLSLASEKDGRIEYITEPVLAGMMGIQLIDEEWNSINGCFGKFEELKMITIDNAHDNGTVTLVRYKDRQTSNSSSYERVKRYRERKKNEAKNKLNDNKNDNVTLRYHDNARIDKNRIDKNIYKKEINKEKSPHQKISYLSSMGEPLIQELHKKFAIPPEHIREEKEKALDWLASSGKKMKDYRAFFNNWLRRSKNTDYSHDREVLEL